MIATSDHELLRRYTQQGAEDAFRELVSRHLDLVWGVARRVTGDADLAKDVAQTVFTDLARKARSLSAQTSLPGWLHRAAWLAAAKLVRANVRRSQREQQAMQLRALEEADPADARAAAQLQPLLDDALGRLNEADRQAVVLRFFSRRSLAEVGAFLGLSDDAAQKRVSRALEKLREDLQHRGVAVSSGVVLLAVTAAGQLAAPGGMAATIAGGSLAAAAAGTGLGWLSGLAGLKAKVALGTLVVAVATVPPVLQHHANQRLETENLSLRQIAAQADSLKTENQRLAALEANARELDQLRRTQPELLRLRAEVTRLRQELANRVTAAAPVQGIGTASVAPAAPAPATPDETGQPQTLEARQIKIINDLKQLGLAARLWAMDNEDKFPTELSQMTNQLPANFDLSLFEFYPHARPVSETEPEMILFHEKQPRQGPDGRWVKAYALADGSVQLVANTPERSFEQYEREHSPKDGAK